MKSKASTTLSKTPRSWQRPVTYATGVFNAKRLVRKEAPNHAGTKRSFVRTRFPASSDSVLVRLTEFDDSGNVLETIDRAGTVTRFDNDDAGRLTTRIDNYQPGGSSSGSGSSSSSSSGGGCCAPSDDTNRTTPFTYTDDGLRATMTALNAKTANQTTTWTFGTTLADSGIASSLLLRTLTYPDGGSDVLSYAYNIQGERVTLTDQRGCEHTYLYDLLGRPTGDCVTTLGTGGQVWMTRRNLDYPAALD